MNRHMQMDKMFLQKEKLNFSEKVNVENMWPKTKNMETNKMSYL